MGDIADAVITKLTNPSIRDEPFEPFNPAPLPDFNNVIADQNTGETAGQQLRRLQSHYQQEVQAVSLKLVSMIHVWHQLIVSLSLLTSCRRLASEQNVAEEDRKRLWKRLLKQKSEVEQAGRAPNAFGAHHGGGGGYTPRNNRVNYIAGYAPTEGYARNQEYSAWATSKALKDQVAADGSIQPPRQKQGDDGLYMRPAGRGRKGMDWDPVRGVWIPHN